MKWKGLEKKFGKMTKRKKANGEGIGGKKVKYVSKKELEREKEALRKFDEESLNRIWGGKIPLKG